MSPDISRPPQQTTGPQAPAPARGFWIMRDIPTALWLALTVAAALGWRLFSLPGWLLLHLLLLGALTHAIMVWSQYFSFALLRSRATVADRRLQTIRLALSNSGAGLVLIGVPTGLWPMTVVGASLLIIAVLWHGISLVRRARGSLPGQFGRTIRYYILAAAMLVIGATLGAIIAQGHTPDHLVLAHAVVNVLGWIGLTVAGTLVTLWPTMLRTRVDPWAATGALRALPFLALGVLIAATGATIAVLPLTLIGLLGYLAGLVVIAVSLIRAARGTPPRSFATYSVGTALLWWTGSIVTLIVATASAWINGHGFTPLLTLLDHLVPFIAAGFAAQVLIGALSYLIPVVLGGGPASVRVGTVEFDRLAALRVTLVNAALVACVLPLPALTHTVGSAIYLVGMASFPVIMTRAMRAQSRSKRQPSTPAPAPTVAERRAAVAASGVTPQPGRRAGQAVAGLMAVLVAIALTATMSPAGSDAETKPAPTGNAPVQTVQVHAANMRFTPNRIDVPVGTRLIVDLTNTDASMVHDLVFANGVAGKRLSPGQKETIDVGVITANLDGWCSVPGHRQLGMTMTVVAISAHASKPSPSAASTSAMPGMPGMSTSPTPSDNSTGSQGGIDLGGQPGKDFHPINAELAPLPPDHGPVTHKLTMTIRNTLTEVAPGVTQTLWTYNGTAPGPVLHGRVGDTFQVTLINDGTMGHSIDFHAGSLAPDKPMRTIEPGQRLTYTFTATRAGIWMYHCSTMPMTAHISNGMYGAVVIEPKNLPTVDRSYVLVQGEYYLGNHNGGIVDMNKVEAGRPDLVVFNGYADQYDYRPLTATVGQRVRIWVLDAGIERNTSFHVVGGQFDTVWKEGAYLLDRSKDTGSQAMDLAPAQGGFVELTFPQAGHYPFVSHYMIDAERGAHGTFTVKAAAHK